jgi:hypothetical protein
MTEVFDTFSRPCGLVLDAPSVDSKASLSRPLHPEVDIILNHMGFVFVGLFVSVGTFYQLYRLHRGADKFLAFPIYYIFLFAA